jgi:DNA repair exonuclease SbcCD nuclease subunit
LSRIAQLAVDSKVDAVLCGGDLYEQERFSPDTTAFLRSTFERLQPIKVFIAPGNHDWYGDQSLYRQVRWTPNVHIFSETRLTAVRLTDGLTLWGGAHRSPARTENFLEHFSTDRGGINLALFHGSEEGFFGSQEAGKAAHAPFRAEQIERARLDHAFLGHFHKPRDADHYTYPGNPDPLEFGEEGERGAVVATIRADGTVMRERRRVAVSEVHDIVLDVSDCGNQQEVRERLASLLAGKYGAIRVILKGELRPEVELPLRDLELVRGDFDVLVICPESVRIAYDFDDIRKQQTVAGEFARDVFAAKDLTDEQRQRILTTGLRALEGRDDLEVL